jgi:hypothetical protein
LSIENLTLSGTGEQTCHMTRPIGRCNGISTLCTSSESDEQQQGAQRNAGEELTEPTEITDVSFMYDCRPLKNSFVLLLETSIQVPADAEEL